MVGGGGYLVLNMVNTLREGDPPFGEENLPRVLGGAIAFTTGFLLHQLHKTKTEYRLGKKYNLKYLPVATGDGK